MKHIYPLLLSFLTLFILSCGDDTYIDVSEINPHTTESYMLQITKDLEKFVTPHFIYSDTQGTNVDTLLLQEVMTRSDSSDVSHYRWNYSNEIKRHNLKSTFKMTFTQKKDVAIEEIQIYILGHRESIFAQTSKSTHIELNVLPWYKIYSAKEVQTYIDELTQTTYQINLDVDKTGSINVKKIETK